MKDKKGFTLIEIMVAMAIIAILAAVVLVSMSSYAVKARSAKALGQVSSAVPSMVSCWGNNGNVVSGTNICDIGSGYGTWPNIASIGYSYNGNSIPKTSSNSWSFTVTGDSLTICCNSGMNSCGIVPNGSCSPTATW